MAEVGKGSQTTHKRLLTFGLSPKLLTLLPHSHIGINAFAPNALVTPMLAISEKIDDVGLALPLYC